MLHEIHPIVQHSHDFQDLGFQQSEDDDMARASNERANSACLLTAVDQMVAVQAGAQVYPNLHTWSPRICSQIAKRHPK